MASDSGYRSCARALTALIAVLLVAGCGARLTAPDRADIRLAGQKLAIVAPPNLCIDPDSLEVGSFGASMLIGDCVLLSGAPRSTPALDAIITATVSPSGLPGSLDQLEAFLRGPGRGTLGKSGEPGKVTILSSSRADGVLFLRVRDSGALDVPGASSRFSRAFFEVSGRLVSGSLIGFAATDIPEGEAQAILASFARQTRAAN